MIEWLITSHFSFLESPKSPEDYFQRALELPHYGGLGLGDRMGIYGIVEAQKARDTLPLDKDPANKFFYAPGIRLHFDHSEPLFVYPLHRGSYARLSTFLSEWALEGLKIREKGLNPLPWRRFLQFLQKEPQPLEDHYLFIWVPGSFYPWPRDFREEDHRIYPHEMRLPEATFCLPPIQEGQFPLSLMELRKLCQPGEASALSLVWPLTYFPGNKELQNWIEDASLKLRIPILASSLPLFTHKEDRELCNLMWAIRHKRTLKELGFYSQANGERRLLSAKELDWHRAQWIERRNLKQSQCGQSLNDPFQRTLELKSRHHFSIHELHYEYPQERLPPGQTRSSHLKALTLRGLETRYPDGAPPEVFKQVEHELKLIHDLKFEDYFLTIYDTLEYARQQKILFQGRGSAANSVVCYCLGITAIDPVRMNLLFERFLSMERNEPPDIDVDFEHERREEVIQELYTRYGRTRAAMVATAWPCAKPAKPLALANAIWKFYRKSWATKDFRGSKTAKKLPRICE
jgi:DNA polymerase III alpha subunit